MLRSDKQKLSQILRKLYAGYNFFKIDNEGNIRFKKKWFSLKKHTTSLKELAVDTVPTVIASYSESESLKYQTNINQMFEKGLSMTDIVDLINKTFSKFLNNHKFMGISPIENRIKAMHKEKLNDIKKPNKFKEFIFHAKTVTKPKLKQKISSVEEKLASHVDLTVKIIGQVCTGNTELDAKYRAIVRYIPQSAGVYCL